MTDTEALIGRHIPRPKARTTKSTANASPGLHELLYSSFFHQIKEQRLTGWIYRQRKVCQSRIPQNVRSLHNILISAARTAGNNSLIDMQPPSNNLILQSERKRFIGKTGFSSLFHLMQDFSGIGIDFINRVDMTRMKWHSNHRFDA